MPNVQNTESARLQPKGKARVAVASSSQIAAEAGAHIVQLGGNAVDAAIAAVLVQMVTEPGMVSLAGAAYVTIWPVGATPIAIDGGVEMPGRGSRPDQVGKGGIKVELQYGGGMSTTVGHASIATPGGLAALNQAWKHHGRIRWGELFGPALALASDGFPLPQTAHNYLRHSHQLIYGLTSDSHAALHNPRGELKHVGDRIVVPHLATSLGEIAEQGVEAFYTGNLAHKMTAEVAAGGGLLTLADLEAFCPVTRPALEMQSGDWTFATQPPPSIGGTTLVAMATMMEGQNWSSWGPDTVAQLVRVQQEILMYRWQNLDSSSDLELETQRLLDRIAAYPGSALKPSPSTVHTSAVDESGLACSITASSGYGSGIMPAGTGIWMNNCLGELELNRRGFHAWNPGDRLPSNMAPTVARRNDGALLSLGSPGADRITSALLQTMLNFGHLGMDLKSAIAHPRLHVEMDSENAAVAYERGLPMDQVTLPTREFESQNMFFGGVGAALYDPEVGMVAAADPRRVGGTIVTSC